MNVGTTLARVEVLNCASLCATPYPAPAPFQDLVTHFAARALARVHHVPDAAVPSKLERFFIAFPEVAGAMAAPDPALRQDAVDLVGPLTALDSLDFTLHSHAAALFSNNDATKCCCALSVRVLLSDVQLPPTSGMCHPCQAELQ